MDRNTFILIVIMIILIIGSFAIVIKKKSPENSVGSETNYARKENVIVNQTDDGYDIYDPVTKEKITTVNNINEVKIYNDDATYNPMPIGYDE